MYLKSTYNIISNIKGGWSSQILNEKLIQSEKDERGRWYVGYLATVRVTLLNGVSHEDCGSGEGINDSKIKAHEKAIKSAVTDAMKRAARHFGERLGNALYVKGNGIRTAPRTNKDALVELERKDALNLFGNQTLLRSAEEDKATTVESVSPLNTSNDAVRTASAATLAASTAAASRTGTHHSFAQQNLGGTNNSNNRSSVQSNRPMLPHPPAPSPIVSRGPLQQQHQQQQRPQPFVQGNTNSNQANTYVRQQQQQQPTLQMAPPPRPMYNPINNNNTAASTACQSSNKNIQQSVAMKRFSSSGSSSSGNGDDNAKRPKLNPYSNNSRLSV